MIPEEGELCNWPVKFQKAIMYCLPRGFEHKYLQPARVEEPASCWQVLVCLVGIVDDVTLVTSLHTAA